MPSLEISTTKHLKYITKSSQTSLQKQEKEEDFQTQSVGSALAATSKPDKKTTHENKTAYQELSYNNCCKNSQLDIYKLNLATQGNHTSWPRGFNLV